ncbi:MAG: hypothetical protein IKH41_05040 [Clostridia bacterium]|nr:hypothetical protein [Clostridia bacterium]
MEEAASKKYVLEEKDNKVVISKDNVAKVFAMMANSPQYKRAANIKKENSSSSYWFDQWKDRELSKDELIKLLTLLNAENSTHTSNEDIDQIKKNILGIKETLKTRLQNADLTLVQHIIDGCKNTPLSFATKFCHYACIYMFEDDARDNFPIFDDIMRKNLGKYSNAWETGKTKGKLKRNLTPKELADSDSEFGISDFYKFYRDCIQTIADENNVSKTGVEQLIWYYHNGNN